MSKPQDAQRTSFPFGNPFRMILPKSSYSSAKHFSLLTAFEQTLANTIRNLIPKNNTEALTFSWIRRAIKSLSETHANIKTLINTLKFPVSNWDEKSMDLYLDNSIKVLDVCNTLTSELSKLDQSQLHLKYALHMLDSDDTSITRVHKSLHDYMEKVHSDNPKLESCHSVLEELASTLHLVKVKKSSKGVVLTRALYGVKVLTVFICNIFMVAVSGSSKQPIILEVSGECLWAQTFNDLQVGINRQFGKIGMVKELEVVNAHVKELHNLCVGMEKETAVMAALKKTSPKLGGDAEHFAIELDLLSKELEEFFQLVLEGRNALLSSFTG